MMPKYIPFKVDENGMAVKDENGKEVYVCPDCGKETTDIVRVYLGSCHKKTL